MLLIQTMKRNSLKGRHKGDKENSPKTVKKGKLTGKNGKCTKGLEKEKEKDKDKGTPEHGWEELEKKDESEEIGKAGTREEDSAERTKTYIDSSDLSDS